MFIKLICNTKQADYVLVLKTGAEEEGEEGRSTTLDFTFFCERNKSRLELFNYLPTMYQLAALSLVLVNVNERRMMSQNVLFPLAKRPVLRSVTTLVFRDANTDNPRTTLLCQIHILAPDLKFTYTNGILTTKSRS